MMKMIYGMLLWAFLVIAQVVLGQVPEPMKNITTPNVSSLGTYGNTPVNAYTGQPNISIPLYDVIEDNLKVPILLTYDLSSVRPNKHPSWVGMGWNLSCGGQITRSVRGVMDEKQAENGYAAGYYAHCGKMKNITSLEALKNHQKYYMHDVAVDGYELSADEFCFSFCGYSGRFYLNEDGGWTVVSDDDIKVEFNETDGFITVRQLRGEIITTRWVHKYYCNRFFNQFVLITPDGVRYTFGGRHATEYSISYYNQSNSDLIPTTWYLSKVENPDGKCIMFEYQAGTPICELKYTPWEVYKEEIYCSGSETMGLGRKALSGYLLFPVYMSKINTTFATVNFHAVAETQDYKQNPQFLASGDQSAHFSPYTARGRQASQFDIFFDNVSSSNLNTMRNNILNAMNWKRLYAIEIQHNREDTLGNKTIYFSYAHPGNYKLLSSITERKGNYKEYSKYVQSGSGVYSKMYLWPPYPTDYVPKDYKFGYDQSKKIPEAVYGSEDQWGYWNGFSFSFTDTAESAITKKGSSVFFAKAETLISITYPTGGRSTFEYEENMYSKAVAPTLISINEEWGRGGGLRIAKITTYASGGQIDNVKKYHYVLDFSGVGSDEPRYSSGILKGKAVYTSLFNTTEHLRVYDLWGKPLNGDIAWLGLRQAGGFIAQPTNDATPVVGYSSVFEETQDADGTCQGYVRYRYFNYDTDIWGENHQDERFLFATAEGESYADQFSSKSQERGKLMAEEYYDANRKMLKSICNKYQKVYGNASEYFKTIYQQTIFLCSEDPMATSYGIFSSAFKTFTYSYLPSECIETTYDIAGGSVVKRYGFIYNQNKQLVEKTIYGSYEDVCKEMFVYSSDLARTGIGLYSEMAGKHILNALVENIQTKNGYVVASNLIKYGKLNSGWYRPFVSYILEINPKVPENSFKGQVDSSGNPLHRAYEVDKEYYYDAYTGNVTCVKDRTGLSTSYLWGYENRYPVAEFRNATIEEMEDALSNTDGLLIFEPHIPEEIIDGLPELKRNIPKAHISVYAYIPLIGIERICDSLGTVEYYEYDELGRLMRVKDVNGHVIKEFNYLYRNLYE